MRHVAQQLATYGRNGDTTLVHMSEGEVHGLRALARATGKDLTVNPHTGLPEAFNLTSLLPIAAAFIPGIGPAAAMALGAGIGAATNSERPLMGAASARYAATGITYTGVTNPGRTVASANMIIPALACKGWGMCARRTTRSPCRMGRAAGLPPWSTTACASRWRRRCWT